MALGLGLHREPPTGSSSDTLFNERRRVVWWIVYSFDSGFSLTTGRPVMSPDCFIETQLPRNIDDTVFWLDPDIMKITLLTSTLQECTLDSTLPAPTENPTTYSAIIAQARLASIGNMVYSDVISASNNALDMRVSRSLDHQLKAWKLSLPVYFTSQDVPEWFRGPRAVVKWKEQNLRMMLWWGSQRLCNLPSDRPEAQNMCHYAAVETIQDITTFCMDCPDTVHIGLNWYATYFLFQATVVLAFHHLRPCQPLGTPLAAANEELWEVSMSKARQCLEFLSRNNKAAARCLEVLDRIRERFQSTQPTSTPLAEPPALDSVPENGDMHLPIDPSLQMFFDANSWKKGIFEGLHGFPITDEVESFDYIPANTLATNFNAGWNMPMDPNLEPT